MEIWMAKVTPTIRVNYLMLHNRILTQEVTVAAYVMRRC
jgi:hypothetical protein